MTLIVGFKNKKIAIIGADTQISIYNGAHEIIDRAPFHKVDLINQNLMFSYLGKWDVFREDKLSEFRDKLSSRKNKVLFALQFVKRIKNDAVLIGFWNCGLIWRLLIKAKRKSKIEKLVFDLGTFYFNDPNSNLPNYSPIEDRIKFYLDNSCSLENYLFAINNTILSEIVQGRDLKIPGLFLNNNRNTVGGYVTIGIIMKNRKFKLRIFNKTQSYHLFKGYQNGMLLDNISNPFNYGLNHGKIVYIDNLAMILKSTLDIDNKNIEHYLVSFLQLQINYLLDNNLLECYQLNQIVNHINKKYDFDLNEIQCDDDLIIANENDLKINFILKFFD